LGLLHPYLILITRYHFFRFLVTSVLQGYAWFCTWIHK
jgi:hypothetical protein